MTKPKKINLLKNKIRNRLTISPVKKKEIQEHLQDIKYSIRNFFLNVNISIKEKRDGYKFKRVERQDKKHHKNLVLTLSKTRFENGISSDSSQITIKTAQSTNQIEESINLIECDHEIQEKLADLLKNIQKSFEDEDALIESSNIKKKKFKKSSKDPHFQLTKQIYQKYIELEEKLDKIEETTEAIKTDTLCILIDVSQIAKMIEIAIDDITNIEEYMKQYLGSDWQKIKHHWQKYKDGEITKNEFVKLCLKSVGLRFVNIFIRTSR